MCIKCQYLPQVQMKKLPKVCQKKLSLGQLLQTNLANVYQIILPFTNTLQKHFIDLVHRIGMNIEPKNLKRNLSIFKAYWWLFDLPLCPRVDYHTKKSFTTLDGNCIATTLG